MKNIFSIIRTTIVGGIFFLLPLAVIIILAGKILSFTQRLIRPVLGNSDSANFGIALYELLGVCVLLVLCLLAGLLAKTKLAKRLITKLEDSVLGFIPGYQILKSQSKVLSGFEQKKLEVVLARVDDGWQISFLIEKLSDNLSAVFIPNVPDPFSGSVYYVDNTKIIKTDITRRQALTCIRQFGAGSAALAKNNCKQMLEMK